MTFQILRCFILALLAWLPSLQLMASPKDDFPVLYKGRFRPAQAYTRLWLYEIYHSSSLKKEDLAAFQTDSPSSLQLLQSIDAIGHTPYEAAPLFWIGSADLKNLIGLPLARQRFSYKELSQTNPDNLLQQNDSLSSTWTLFREFETLYGIESPIEQAFQKRLMDLQSQSISSKEIERRLEQEFPLEQRLRKASPLFKSLPSRSPHSSWFPLQALLIQVYDPTTNSLKPIGNFTLYSTAEFSAIRQAYSHLIQMIAKKADYKALEKQADILGNLLIQAYRPLAGQIYQRAHGKNLHYPSISQLKVEAVYISTPWIPVLIFIYASAACLLIVSARLPSSQFHPWALGMVVIALAGHTMLLAARCYILGRPPVANMFETVLYVPWVAGAAAILFPLFRQNIYALLATCLASIILLVVLEGSNLNQNLEQVQAVLDSQFWLFIHVLLVVGSYGIYFLGALLGHFYLGFYLRHRTETAAMQALSTLILQSLYGGTLLLVTGTILGGIWAAESWGRFWDWDPKESWAFITCCFYLIWIHAFRFHRISSFGLAIGAVSGFLAVSFTWYGVNYILGTGLHSYGFGSGGEIVYYGFLAAECAFLTFMLWVFSSERHKRHIGKALSTRHGHGHENF